MGSNSVTNSTDINQALAKNYIHYEPSRIDYSVNSFELELIEQTGSSVWKDVFLCSVGIAVPCIINALDDCAKLSSENQFLTTNIFLNCLFGGLGIILGIISFIVWRKNKSNFGKIIGDIKNKPKFEMP